SGNDPLGFGKTYGSHPCPELPHSEDMAGFVDGGDGQALDTLALSQEDLAPVRKCQGDRLLGHSLWNSATLRELRGVVLGGKDVERHLTRNDGSCDLASIR